MRKSGERKVSISGARSELGYVLRHLSPRRGSGSVHINLAGQQATVSPRNAWLATSAIL